MCRPVRALRRPGRTAMRARHSSSPLIRGAALPQSSARWQAGAKPDGTSMCCRDIENGIDVFGVKHSINPGVQLVRIRSQHLTTVRLRNTVKAPVQQDRQMELAPGPPSAHTMLVAVPFAGAVDLQTGAVDH